MMMVFGVVLLALLTGVVALRPRGGGGTSFTSPSSATPGPGAADPLAALDVAARARIEELAAAGLRIRAIEALRAATGCRLSEAKVAIDKLLRA